MATATISYDYRATTNSGAATIVLQHETDSPTSTRQQAVAAKALSNRPVSDNASTQYANPDIPCSDSDRAIGARPVQANRW